MRLKLIALASVMAAGGLAAAAAVAQPPGHPGPGGPFGLLAFDANADGKVTRAEFDAAQKARFGQIDANKDGTATPEEFKAFHQAQAETFKVAASKERFAKLDADGNGQVSADEFAKATAERGRGPEGRHGRRGPGRMERVGDHPDKHHGPRADGNDDGKVTFAEFSARGIEGFSRADANKDGTVTIAELQALRPGGR
jgi:Ca2+-binding EF-hand superfamily protein